MVRRLDQQFAFHDSLRVPGALVSAHSTPTTQSIFVLGPHSSEEALLIRLVFGAVLIKPRGEREVPQRRNFAIMGAPPARATTISGLDRTFAAINLDSQALDRHLRRNLSQRAFFADILFEATHFIFAEAHKAHCRAFIHIYRMLERIAFAFPVIYAAKTTDFRSAYSGLRDLFTKEQGELKFFERFSETVIDSVVLDARTKFDVAHLYTRNRVKALESIKNCIGDPNHITSYLSGDELEVKNRALLSLLIGLRNRFFHFLSGDARNLSITTISDPDRFFETVNTVFFNWLCILYIEILQEQCRRV